MPMVMRGSVRQDTGSVMRGSVRQDTGSVMRGSTSTMAHWAMGTYEIVRDKTVNNYPLYKSRFLVPMPEDEEADARIVGKEEEEVTIEKRHIFLFRRKDGHWIVSADEESRKDEYALGIVHTRMFECSPPSPALQVPRHDFFLL